jgi:hypothetical protein
LCYNKAGITIEDFTVNLPAPYRVIETLDRAFRIYRNNFITYSGVSALFTVPLMVGRLLLGDQPSYEPSGYGYYNESYNWDSLGGILFWVLGLLALEIIFQWILANSLFAVIASENHLGYPCAITQALPKAQFRFLKLAKAWILYAIVYGCFSAIVVAASMICIGALLMPLLLYMAFCNFIFLVPTIVLEDVGTWAGFQRALALGKVQFWRAFGFSLALLAIVLVIEMTLEVLIQVLPSQDVLVTVVQTIGAVFIAPIFPIGYTLLYYDIRTRVEGLDIAMGTLIKPNPRPSDVLSPPPSARWLTGQDIVNVVILTIVAAAIFGLLWLLLITLAYSAY